eukprot:TRINITY_DN4763_c0_g1_i1.p1 TRINITY_DN4763_c0_g1~~TRINITY_DN4763_c0_g1_i1.p1  ORF type:complete len:238 (+),score=49.15 TRINITY_DN4763_c0_g1_i1:39-716(+)
MTSDVEKISELDPSELGKKDYWENAYKLELTNYADHGDVGEVWFGEDAGQRMVNWMSEHPEYILPGDAILDNGTGNGMLCMDMAEEGFTNVTGVDYCQEAILLAQKIRDEAGCDVDFQVGNILDKASPFFQKKFKVVTDKGTFDAISLSETAKTDKLTYIANTASILEDTGCGLFIITSCNWTEHELTAMFATHFKHLETIPTPSFTFGGKQGNTVTTVIFQKLS